MCIDGKKIDETKYELNKIELYKKINKIEQIIKIIKIDVPRIK